MGANGSAEGDENRICLQNIQNAARTIKPFVHHTPVLTSDAISSMCGEGIILYFKCELFQKTGSFKIRGALNATLSLPKKVASVVTHSSGNHAQALAYAGKVTGRKAYIVMPKDAPPCKVAAVQGYGGTVTFVESSPLAREEGCAQLMKSTNAAFIHPSNDPKVILGQGTVGLELARQVRALAGADLDAVVVPLGGGGLTGGIAVAVKSLLPNAKIIAAEPSLADDAYRSKLAGEMVLNEGTPKTIADGLKTNLGSNTWPIIRDYVDQIITVSEDEIKRAMRIVYERLKVVIEPSAAVGVAAALSPGFPAAIGKEEDYRRREEGIGRVPRWRQYRPLRVGLVLCGGNIDLDHFQDLIL
mmetsp:Transcript_9494/g.16096  ORF Transcript_9494/g.16096 Transcript_9494/m.16096 type:complete len:358 (-) Transcript_9494:247-1320(-)